MPKKISDTKKSSPRASRGVGKKTKAPAAERPRSATATAEGLQCFWVNGGPVVCTLLDLRQALAAMSDEQYMHHTDGRNDFAAWVRDVFNDVECAHLCGEAQARAELIAVLDRILA